MKDIVTPVPPEEVRGMIKKCLETAALVNYTRLSSEAKIEGNFMFNETRFSFIVHVVEFRGLTGRDYGSAKQKIRRFNSSS